jgi:hypothetical protein
MWARHDLRRRWASLVALGILAGITAGLALAAFAGARRTGTALDRLAFQTHASDAVVFPSQVNAPHPDWTLLVARPEVRTLAVWDLLFGNVNDQPGALLFGSHDGTFLGTLDRPVVTQGRMFDPASPDEVVVDEHATKDAPLGSSFVFQPYSRGHSDTTGEPPTGPKVTLHVVGVVRDIEQFLFISQGQVLVSPGFIAHYGPQIQTLENANVALTHGARDIPALQRDVDGLLAPGTPVLDLYAVRRRVMTTLNVERSALTLLAAAIALAGGFLVAQALIRSAAVIGDDVLPLRATGMTRTDVALAGTLPHGLSAVVAVAVAFATAVVSSDALPVGLGRRVDPGVGFHADWTVIAPGLALVGLVVLGAAALVARGGGQIGGQKPAARSPVATWIRQHAPLTVGLGTGMTFERTPGRSGSPARAALVGAVVGIVGIVATLSIDQGILDALAHPEQAGVAWDADIAVAPTELGAHNVSADLAPRILSAAGDGADIAVIDRFVIPVAGAGVPLYSVRPVSGRTTTGIRLTRRSGKAPAGMGQAAIGPATARELHVRVGDSVSIGTAGARVQLVGEALFPTDVHAEFDEGLWVTPEQYDELVAPMAEAAVIGRTVALSVPRGRFSDTVASRVQQALGPRVTGVNPVTLPDELSNLHNIRLLPVALAGFLALVAMGAVTHALVTSTRRRRRDFAVLRALGLGRGSIRRVLHAQGTSIGLVGLLFGVPLGLAAGRIGWRLVAASVPLSVVDPLALVALALLIPATVVVVNALSVWPGDSLARRCLPAEALRAE